MFDDVLSKIKDINWVLHTCSFRVGSTAKETRLLLKYGLKLTDHLSLTDVNNEIEDVLNDMGSQKLEPKPSISLMLKYRLLYLGYLDRLDAHFSIFGPSQSLSCIGDCELMEPFDIHFSQFRDEDILELCCLLDSDGNIQAVEVLWTRFSELQTYRFMILDHLPATMNPLKYTHLTPTIKAGKIVAWNCIPLRESDWCEDEYVLEFIGESKQDRVELDDLDQNGVTEWFINRAIAIEYFTGNSIFI